MTTDMIASYNYKSNIKGPKLAFMGAIHGNEICGTRAIQAVLSDLNEGNIHLKKGSLLFIPIANPQAFHLNKRFIDENLNRVFYKSADPVTYESKIANHLTHLLADCDVLIDFHSIHTKGWPFAMHFGFFSEEEEALIAATAVPYIITGWEKAYKSALPDINRGQSRHTVSYMHDLGKIAVGIECGKHDDPHSVVIAREIINRVLSHLDMIDNTFLTPVIQPTRIDLDSVFLRKSDQDILAAEFTHGHIIQKGQPLAQYANGNIITAEKEGFVLFPRPECPIGEEWFYTGSLISSK